MKHQGFGPKQIFASAKFCKHWYFVNIDWNPKYIVSWFNAILGIFFVPLLKMSISMESASVR